MWVPGQEAEAGVGGGELPCGSLLSPGACRMSSGFCPCVSFVCCVSCWTVLDQLLVSSFSSVFVQFRHSSVHCDSYSHSSAVEPLT